ncbi:hypothetical protein CLOACE_15720 [Clostridium acetireducens DSM 10703]|jgi:uncharacterized membrane protein YjjB (DUF3815 family)|uniref:Threonine/Serine exporter ThrE domain-containing protein n=1 Tax=Clostridium acetireducens DSM 10703 TaxID=1121290 RepID=A0A1E8EXR0_9CLOT|nr:threonine/serine exporter family protein [Clostridium acetireducens]OFI05566.1 hypothetical protein CLOACE_15720 [Clostridium acetireducens DSM 10703]
MILNCIFACIASLGYCITFNVKGKKIIYTALGGGIGWFFYLLTAKLIPSSSIFSYFVASTVISIYGEIMARIMKIPVTIFVICAIIPLVPGGGMYYTMFESIQGNANESLLLGINTLSIAGAIAAGILLVSSITKAILFYTNKNK